MQIGDEVMWSWGVGVAHGKVVEVCPGRTHIESKDKVITRNGTPQNPAVIIRHNSGSLVLKLQSELRMAR